MNNLVTLADQAHAAARRYRNAVLRRCLDAGAPNRYPRLDAAVRPLEAWSASSCQVRHAHPAG